MVSRNFFDSTSFFENPDFGFALRQDVEVDVAETVNLVDQMAIDLQIAMIEMVDHIHVSFMMLDLREMIVFENIERLAGVDGCDAAHLKSPFCFLFDVKLFG